MLDAGRLFAWVAAVSLFVAAAWYGLIEERITVDEPPPGATVDSYYQWFESTLTQERLDTAIGILAFASIIVVGAALRDRLSADGPRAAVGNIAVTVGSLLWIVGNVLALGGHRAVGKMSESGNPIEAVNSINFTVDTVDDSFELFAFAFLGVGVLALAWEGLRVGERRSWLLLSGLIGIVMLVLAGAYAADNFDLIDPLLVAGGAILLPAWLIWSAETVLRQRTPEVVAEPRPVS
jgi:hypothetical protein